MTDPTPPQQRKASTTTTIFTKHLHDERMKKSGAWIIAISQLEGNPGLDAIKAKIKDKVFNKYVRFRSQLALNEKREAIFVESPEPLDEAYHFHEESCDQPWSIEQMNRYIGDLNDFEYDLSKPLWRIILIPKLENGQAASVLCVNHAIGDGLALVEVNESLYEPIPEEEHTSNEPIRHGGKKPPKRNMDMLSQMGVFLYGLFHGLSAPLSTPDPKTPLRLDQGLRPLGKKWIASAEPIDLNRVKQIKNKMAGCTINDVLMGLMTMTLKSFFLEEKPSFDLTTKVTASFPISMRAVGEGGLGLDGEPHNRISFAYFDFHFTGSRIDIVWQTKHQIDCIKISPSPLVVMWSLHLANMILPEKQMLDFTNDSANRGTAQLSNVPAPQRQVKVFGKKVEQISFYLFSPLSVYLGILSYNGQVTAAFNLDSGLDVDPNKLTKHWNQEFEKLYEEVMSQPGDTLPEPKHDTEFYRKVAIGFLSTIAAIIGMIVLSILVRVISTKLGISK